MHQHIELVFEMPVSTESIRALSVKPNTQGTIFE